MRRNTHMALAVALLALVWTGPGPRTCQAAAATTAAPGTTPALPHVEVPEIPARPEDVESLDGIIAALYDSLSGPAGQPRQWARERTLYLPTAQLVALGRGKDGSVIHRVMDHALFVDRSNPSLVTRGFFEREVHRTVRRFSGLAHVFSTYESRFTPDGPLVERGVNSIDLFFDGKRWWITLVSWEVERPDNPIPGEFLPAR